MSIIYMINLINKTNKHQNLRCVPVMTYDSCCVWSLMLVSESTYIFTNYFTLHIWTLDISLLYNQNDTNIMRGFKKKKTNNKKQYTSVTPGKIQNKNPIDLILSIHTVSLFKLPLLPNRKVKQYSQLVEAGFSWMRPLSYQRPQNNPLCQDRSRDTE